MSSHREFSLEEANALVPTLHRLVSPLMVLRHEIEDALRALHRMLGGLPRELAPRDDDADDVRAAKQHVLDLLGRFETGWNEVSGLGCVVKDPEVGLVDFLGSVDGRSVWLCWKFGEEAVSHYHALDEGFADRRAIAGAEAHVHKIWS